MKSYLYPKEFGYCKNEALSRLALSKSEPYKLEPSKFAPVRFAPVKFTFCQSSPPSALAKLTIGGDRRRERCNFFIL